MKTLRRLSFKEVMQLIRWPNLLILGFVQWMSIVFLCHLPGNRLQTVSEPYWWLLTFCTVLVAAAGYAINDYYDTKIDLINKPRRVLVGFKLRRRQAIFWHLLLTSTALVAGWWLGLKIWLVLVASSFFLWIYSAFLKRLPFVGNLLVALLTGLAVGLPALAAPVMWRQAAVFAVYAFFVSLVREIIKDLEDLRGDEAFGCKTLPIVWGIRRTKRFIYFLTALFIASLFSMSVFLGSKVGLFYFLLMPPLAFIIYKLVYADTSKAFGQLSLWCKWLMVAGTLSMALV